MQELGKLVEQVQLKCKAKREAEIMALMNKGMTRKKAEQIFYNPKPSQVTQVFPYQCYNTEQNSEVKPRNEHNKKLDKPYYKVYLSELDDPSFKKLSPNARLVYIGSLMRHEGFKTNKCWLSRRTIMEDTGLSEWKVRTALDELEKGGWFERTTHLYTISGNVRKRTYFTLLHPCLYGR